MAERRRAVGVSLRGVARSAGLSPAHLSDIERGRRLPSETAMRRIFDALAVPPESRDYWWAAAGLVEPDLIASVRAAPSTWSELRDVLAWLASQSP